MRATRPAHLILLDFINVIWWGPLCGLRQSPDSTSLLGSNIFLSTLFSNSLSQCFSLTVNNHVSHQHRTPCTIIGLYLYFNFYILWLANRSPTFIHSLIPQCVLWQVHSFFQSEFSAASSFNLQYPPFSLTSSISCLRPLPRLPVTTIRPSIFPPITCFRMQFLRKMWPILHTARILQKAVSCMHSICSCFHYGQALSFASILTL